MLTQLQTVKARLAILDTDTQYDSLLTNAIKAVSARFDKETNRTLARTEALCQEFDSADTEVVAICYPIETVTKFELKFTQSAGWLDQPPPDYLIRQSCIISLSAPLDTRPSTLSALSPLARVTYTGGYLLPGSDPVPSATPLPDDLEQAAVEQVAYWYQTRDKLGLKTTWPHGGTYEQFAQLPLLLPVQATVSRYARFTL